MPTAQPSQGKGTKAQGLTQLVQEITTAQIAQNPAHKPGFVDLIIQAQIRFRSYKSTFWNPWYVSFKGVKRVIG